MIDSHSDSSAPPARSALMLSRLVEMKSVPHSGVHLMAFKFNSPADLWRAQFEYDNEGTKIRLDADADTPCAAVEALYQKWISVYRNGMPELRPALLVSPPDTDSLPF